jgi:hypothetical protein
MVNQSRWVGTQKWLCRDPVWWVSVRCFTLEDSVNMAIELIHWMKRCFCFYITICLIMCHVVIHKIYLLSSSLSSSSSLLSRVESIKRTCHPLPSGVSSSGTSDNYITGVLSLIYSANSDMFYDTEVLWACGSSISPIDPSYRWVTFY